MRPFAPEDMLTQVTYEMKQYESIKTSGKKFIKIADTEKNRAVLSNDQVDQKLIELVQEDDHLLLHVKDQDTFLKLKPLLKLIDKPRKRN